MKKNIIWNTGGNIFYSFCMWAITIMVVWLASFEQAGYLSLAMSVSSSCSTIALFNMRSFQITDVKREFSTEEYITSRVVTSLLAVIVCGVISFVGNDLYQAFCINLFMIIKLVEAGADVFHGIDQKYDRFDIIGLSYILRGLGYIICFPIGLLISGKLWIAILLTSISHVIIFLLFDIRSTKKLERISRLEWNRHIVELLLKCIPLVIFLFLLNMINTLAKKVLSLEFGTEDLGIYSSIASPTLVVQVFAMAVFNPFLPRISNLDVQKKKSELRQMLTKIYLAFIGLSVVVNIGAMLLGRWGLSLLLGEKILEYYELFLPIVWVTILYSVVFVLSQIMISFRKIKEIIIGVIVIMIMFAVIVYPSMVYWGLNGASYSQIIAFLVFIPYMIFVCERHMKKEIDITC